PTRPHPRSPDTPPGNLIVGAAAGMIDKARDVGKQTVDRARAGVGARRGPPQPASTRDLHRPAVAPLAQHQVVALEGGMVVVAEAHRGAFDATRRGELLDPFEAFLDAGAGQVMGAGDALAEQPSHVVGAAADGPGGGAFRLR